MENTKIDINEHIRKAQKCEDYGEFETALKYYKEVLDVDPKHSSARIGADRMMEELSKKVYYQKEANLNLTKGRLELRQGMLVFVGSNGVNMEFFIEKMENPRVALGRLTFDYQGSTMGFSCGAAKEMVGILKNAKEGQYPRMDQNGMTSLEKYISEHFDENSVDEAIEYFCQMSNISPGEARIAIEKIFG